MEVNDIATQQTVYVSINGNKLVTSVLYKPTESHSYLPFSYFHTKRSISFSQILRRICSEEDFQAKSLEMRHFLSNMAIPPLYSLHRLPKASQIPQSETLTDPVSNVKGKNKIPLVLQSISTYFSLKCCELRSELRKFVAKFKSS